jgi:hypothetical protein
VLHPLRCDVLNERVKIHLADFLDLLQCRIN